ncbi:aldose 1-epimerase [Segnochrobactrum spirostomi]|uniref:Aldose 1-epimerase n=1 Tax=Segnochrobactrum spirostomi TaxID=2608987 RepID=A0A6A7Y851_9HYPH|nr:aldose 1-epimerase [Segnochrobactrum spirostomi]MQT15530.1 aldose 1-epimerase [Segnochrobactrum spirostomi]
MATLHLAAHGFDLGVSTRGGVVTRLGWRGDDGARVPLLREVADDPSPEHAAAFPMVPFGSRLRGNGFAVGGVHHRFAPNTVDPLYLHGDGWLGTWEIERQDDTALTLAFAHRNGDYDYEARQTFALAPGLVSVGLSVVNRGSAPMPYGLGWHPYFPRAADTRLTAPYRFAWTEGDGYLPEAPVPPPPDLDFAAAAPIPDRWINTLLEGWSGRAEIVWPARRTGLALEADASARHAVMYASDAERDPSYRGDWFCFEPMTHLAGANDRPDLGGLVLLAPGESLSLAVRLSPRRLSDPFEPREAASS